MCFGEWRWWCIYYYQWEEGKGDGWGGVFFARFRKHTHTFSPPKKRDSPHSVRSFIHYPPKRQHDKPHSALLIHPLPTSCSVPGGT